MSRFSLGEAQALGWKVVHAGDGAGPEKLRAEKQLSNGALITQEANTTGLLLERVFAYEANLARHNLK